jgi:phosphonate transport system substrate-binding protein
MTLSRRTLLALAAAGVATPALAQQAGDWRRRFPEIRIGISSAENEGAALARQEPMAAYLSRELGVPVRLYRTSDYAGLVEAMRADQIEFARFGPAVYALGRRVLGEKLRPLFRDVDNNGQEGYFSTTTPPPASPSRATTCASKASTRARTSARPCSRGATTTWCSRPRAVSSTPAPPSR